MAIASSVRPLTSDRCCSRHGGRTTSEPSDSIWARPLRVKFLIVGHTVDLPLGVPLDVGGGGTGGGGGGRR